MTKRYLWIALAAVLMFLSGCSGNDHTNSEAVEAYHEIVGLAVNGDWGGLYDRMDEQSKRELEMPLRMVAGMTAVMSGNPDKIKQIEKMNSREVFAEAFSTNGELGGKFKAREYEVKVIEQTEDRAKLKIEAADGHTEEVNMVKENGEWKLVLTVDNGARKSQ